jgi:hypothetical protein
LQQQKVKILNFLVRPVVSSSGEGGGEPFGPFYVDEEVTPYGAFNLTALLASGDNRKVEATKMAIQWIQSHP